MSDRPPIFSPSSTPKLVSSIKPAKADPRIAAAKRMSDQLLAPARNARAAALQAEIARKRQELKKLKGR